MAKRKGARPRPAAAVLDDLLLFDGSSTDVLGVIVADWADEPNWVDGLLMAARDGDDNPRSAAIWLVRQAQREGWSLSRTQIERLIALVPLATRWDQRLNLLQILDGVRVPPPLVKSVLAFAYAGAGDPNAFVRAWALSVLIKVGLRRKAERHRIERLIEDAHRDKASVRARVRRALEEAEERDGN